MKESYEIYRQLFEKGLPQVVTGSDGTVQLCNAAFTELFSVDTTFCDGKDFSSLMDSLQNHFQHNPSSLFDDVAFSASYHTASALLNDGRMVSITRTALGEGAFSYQFRTVAMSDEIISRLRDDVTLLQSVFSNTYQFSAILTTEGRVITVNDTALTFAGTDLDHVRGALFWETPWWTFDTAVQEQLMDGVEKAAKGENVHYITENMNVNGDLRTVDFSMKPVYGQGTDILMLIAEGHDITDEIIKQDALRRSERTYREIFNTTTSGILVHEIEDGSISDVNDAAMDIFGVSRDQIIEKGTDIYCCSGNRDKDRFMRHFTKAVAGEMQLFEWSLRGKEGNVLWLEIMLKEVYLHDERFILSVLRDITRRREAQSALREREIMLDGILSAVPLGIGLIDNIEDRSMNWGNDAAVMITGYRLDELTGNSTRMLYATEEEYQRTGKVFFTQIQETGRGDVETVLRHKNGTLFDARIIMIPWMHGEDTNSVMGAIVVLEDITERRRYEREKEERNNELLAVNEELNASIDELEAAGIRFEKKNQELEEAKQELEKSERRFRRMADSIHEGIEIVENGKVVYTNPRFHEIMGREPGEIESLDFFDVVAAEDRERIRTIIEEARKSGKGPEELEFWIVHPDGTRRYIHKGFSYSEDSENKDDRYVVTSDLTERKEHETLLSRLATVVEQADEDITITDTEGTIIYVNPAFERITGYTAQEALGNNPSILKSGEHDQSFYQILWQTITRGDVWTGRFANLRRDGTRMLQDATITPIKNEKNEITGYVALKRDVTAHESMARQLLQAQKMEAVGNLAGGLAHDFNNVLGGMVGSVSLLEMLLGRESLQATEKIESYIDILKKASGRAADMINQLLTLSRRNESARTVVNLDDSVKHVVKLCKNSFPKSIHIAWEKYEGGEAVVLADPTQVEQVLLNLAVNGSHAMTIMRDDEEGGELRFSIHQFHADMRSKNSHPDARPGQHYYVVQVSDNGVGMDRATLDKIFDPFFTTKSRDNGTGLGLAMTYNIVQQHGGFISVYSEEGVGTTFNIYFPGISEEDRVAGQPDHSTSLVKGNGTILVVDDEEIITTVSSDILNECGYATLVANEALKGVELFRDNWRDIDAVILDMSMPVMSGLDVFRKLKEIDPSVKVLMATGFKLDDRVEKARELGVKRMIQKPFAAYTLSRELADLINQK